MLAQRAEELLEGEATAFPFLTEAGYNISGAEASSVDRAVRARAAAGEKMPLCVPSTYDGHSVSVLAGVFAPGSVGELTTGDEVVDLGAGIGKVLAVVALTSNASARGIELSTERHAIGCNVLRLLERAFKTNARLAARRVAGLGVELAAACPASRRLELWHGDLLAPPPALLEPPVGARAGSMLTFFAYANCLPYGLLAQLMRLVAGTRYACVRLLTTKAPVAWSAVQEGLRRIRGGGLYTLYVRDGDRCRAWQ